MIEIVVIVALILIAGYALYPSPWDRSPNMNFMDGKVNNSQRLLGTTITERGCAALCEPQTWCNYYTWDGSKCWGLVNKIAVPYEQTGVFSGARK